MSAANAGRAAQSVDMLDFDLRPAVGAWIGVGRRSNCGFGRWAGVADCRLAWDLRYGVRWFVATGTRRVRCGNGVRYCARCRWKLVEPSAARVRVPRSQMQIAGERAI